MKTTMFMTWLTSDIRLLYKSEFLKFIFLIFQQIHMLWVLKRTISMRWFFWAPKTYTMSKKKRRILNIHCIWRVFHQSIANNLVWALTLGLWVPGFVLAIIVIGRNWFSSLNLRFYRSWRCVIGWWLHACALSGIVPICQKRYLRRSIILAWQRNCWAITERVTLACNILIAFSRSTCVRFGIVN